MTGGVFDSDALAVAVLWGPLSLEDVFFAVRANKCLYLPQHRVMGNLTICTF